MNEGSLPFFHKIGWHGNVPWDKSEKEVQIDHLHPKRFHSVKTGSVDPEIIVPEAIIKNVDKKKDINASKIDSLSGKFAERAKKPLKIP